MGRLPDKEIEILVRQKLEGESYTQIRTDLTDRGLSEEEIRATIREVDERVLRTEIELGKRNRSRSIYWVGLALAIIGLLLAVGSNAGIILRDVPRWIVYSPFFAGILLMFYARMLQRRQVNPLATDSDRIRRKRPYK